jgi:hypothetical protein
LFINLKIVVGKCEGKIPLRKAVYRKDDDVRVDPKSVRFDDLGAFILLRIAFNGWCL